MNKVKIGMVEQKEDASTEAISEIRTKSSIYFGSLMDSIMDGVIIVDLNGVVLHVNSSFKELVGESNTNILGQNIFEIFPNNPLVKCLRLGEKVSGQGYVFYDGYRELSYIVNPILLEGRMTGALAIFKAQPDVIKLMEELQRSSKIIETLYNRLGAVNGLAEINVSDIVPIDKMEQIMLRHALAQYGYTVEGKKKAAKALNISLATLYNKLKKYQFN